MISHVNFFKVGRTDEIISSGWIRVTLLGWDIVVLFHQNEFIAIERGGFDGIEGLDQKPHLADNDTKFSKSGSPNIINKFMAGPDGALWGKLRQFPVRVQDESVFVGVVQE